MRDGPSSSPSPMAALRPARNKDSSNSKMKLGAAATKAKHGRATLPSSSSLPNHPSTSDLVYGRITSISPLPATTSTASPSPLPPAPPTIVYRSPRCQVDDADLFPTQRSFDQLQRPDERWTYQSRVAGQHRQAIGAYHVPSRTTPHALAAGIPKHFAQQVTELHLPGRPRDGAAPAAASDDDGLDSCQQHYQHLLLPEWLDVVATTFPSVRHLYLNAATGLQRHHDVQVTTAVDETGEEGTTPRSSSAATATSSSSERLQRLYVLYRLPQLLSIDGVPVSDTERELARPEDPRGHKVKRDAWVPPPCTKDQHRRRQSHQGREPPMQLNSMGDELDDSEDDCDDCDHDDDFCRSDSYDASIDGPMNSSSALGVASTESLVEVDLAGGLHMVDLVDAPPPPPPPLPSSNHKRRGLDPPALFGVVLTPLRRATPPKDRSTNDELMNLPYESPESSIDCEWGVACGGLSLPMMRSPGIANWSTEEFDAAGTGLPLLMDRRASEFKLDVPKVKRTASASLGPRVTSRESLSSPFPMQFRTRARADGTLSPSLQAVDPPPPPPPVRLPSRHRSYVVTSSSIDSTNSATIPPPPPPPPRSSRRRRDGHPRSAPKNDGGSESPARTESVGDGVEVAPLSQVQKSLPPTDSSSKSKTGRHHQLPPTIPSGTASARSQRSKAIWAAKRMARSMRRRRMVDPTNHDQPGSGKNALGTGVQSSPVGDSNRSSRVTASILDQDTEEEDDDDDSNTCSSTGSPTASYDNIEASSDDDCGCSDEENRVHLVLG